MSTTPQAPPGIRAGFMGVARGTPEDVDARLCDSSGAALAR